MGKQVVKLTESQIREIVTESVNRILKENDMDEGFFDNIKSAYQGAKQGYNYQKAMDRGTEGFKTEHDYEDMKKDSNPFGPRSENTAQEQANQVAAAQTPQQNNEQTVYIAPDHGTKYHLNPNCSGLNNANSVVAISLQEAQARGYTLCKRG